MPWTTIATLDGVAAHYEGPPQDSYPCNVWAVPLPANTRLGQLRVVIPDMTSWFEIDAVKIVGTSLRSTDPLSPGFPGIHAALRSPKAIALTWEAPLMDVFASQHQARWKAWIVKYADGPNAGNTACRTSPKVFTCRVHRLTKGQTYRFTVSRITSRGEVITSAPSHSVRIPKKKA